MGVFYGGSVTTGAKCDFIVGNCNEQSKASAFCMACSYNNFHLLDVEFVYNRDKIQKNIQCRFSFKRIEVTFIKNHDTTGAKSVFVCTNIAMSVSNWCLERSGLPGFKID